MTLQKEMIKFINVARQHPTYFISLIEKQINSFTNEKQIPLNDEIIYETNQGKKAWIQALNYLKQQKSINCLQEHQGLNLSSRDHALDLSTNNIFGHTGSDGSTFSQRILKYCRKGHGSMAQLIGADFNFENRNHAEMTVLGLIIDDGVSDRGHRKTIFNPSYKFIGCKSEIQGQKVITVFNLTQNQLTLRTHSNLQNIKPNIMNKTSNSYFQNPAKSLGNGQQLNKDQRFCKTQFFQSKSPSKLSYEKEPLKDKMNKQKILSNFEELRKPQNKKSFQQTKKSFRQQQTNENSNNFKKSDDIHSFSKSGRDKFVNSGGSQNFRQSPSKGSKVPSSSQVRKVSQKKQSSKVYYEEGCKITQITTRLLYNDGTIEQKIDKHTVYLEE